MEAFIDDGYTEAGYIAAVDRLHPECRFTYRPMRPEERAAMIDAINKSKARSSANAEATLAAAVAKHLVSWSFDREPTKDSVRLLRYSLFEKLAGIICYGIRGSDPDPESQSLPGAVVENEYELAQADLKN